MRRAISRARTGQKDVTEVKRHFASGVSALAAVAVVAACAASSQLFPIAYTMVDQPILGLVELSYRNDTRGNVCLSPEQWPNQAGKIDQASDHVALIVDGRRLPIEDFNTGYCVGGCATVVAPGETVQSSIKYEDFRLPDELRRAPKALSFVPLGFRCRRGAQ